MHACRLPPKGIHPRRPPRRRSPLADILVSGCLALSLGLPLQAICPGEETKEAPPPGALPPAGPDALGHLPSKATHPSSALKALSIRSSFDPFHPAGDLGKPSVETDVHKVLEHYIVKDGDNYRINMKSVNQVLRDQVIAVSDDFRLPPDFIDVDKRRSEQILRRAADFLPLFFFNESNLIHLEIVYHATSSETAKKVLASGFSFKVENARDGSSNQFGYSILGLGSGVYACEKVEEVQGYVRAQDWAAPPDRLNCGEPRSLP